jgi:transcription elongation factor GreB
MEKKNYITPQGLEKLRSEYQQLLQIERPKIVETVAWAASNGDRSENADYIYGKRRLREIDSRLRFLVGRMEKADVVDPSVVTSDRIVFGALVTVEDEDGNENRYQIVGEDEIDIPAGKISWKSPIAKALLGKKAGDEVVVQKPKGPETLCVVQIEYK